MLPQQGCIFKDRRGAKLGWKAISSKGSLHKRTRHDTTEQVMWTTRTQLLGMVGRDKPEGSEPNGKKQVPFLEHEPSPLWDGNP